MLRSLASPTASDKQPVHPTVFAGVHLQATRTSTSYVWTASMLSPHGRCRALDLAADGYVRGETVIAAVLATAEVAAAAGSSSGPLAHIRGSAVNQDGRSSSLTAPNGPAQQEVIRAGTMRAAEAPAAVLGLSMHGTGARWLRLHAVCCPLCKCCMESVLPHCLVTSFDLRSLYRHPSGRPH